MHHHKTLSIPRIIMEDKDTYTVESSAQKLRTEQMKWLSSIRDYYLDFYDQEKLKPNNRAQLKKIIFMMKFVVHVSQHNELFSDDNFALLTRNIGKLNDRFSTLAIKDIPTVYTAQRIEESLSAAPYFQTEQHLLIDLQQELNPSAYVFRYVKVKTGLATTTVLPKLFVLGSKEGMPHVFSFKVVTETKPVSRKGTKKELTIMKIQLHSSSDQSVEFCAETFLHTIDPNSRGRHSLGFKMGLASFSKR